MDKLTKNISRKEVACRCGCGLDTIDHEVITIVQEAADYFAKERGIEKSVVIITSGVRCPRHNNNVKGELKSQHTLCRAIDFIIRGVTSSLVANYLGSKYPDKYGVGKYKAFTHIDTKSGNARRWSN